MTFVPNISNELVIENTNKKVNVFLNEKAIYELEYQQKNGSIMGIDCVFKGCGVIESILLEELEGGDRYFENFSFTK